ncbi:MAG: hydrogenase maturation nickel metallochaperone HypA [Candidatus Omnitrophica bacterium]|nr:hydrogenase maturation nickel metallochaperone HypA [Candidatus Omnitrophota bacterium]
MHEGNFTEQIVAAILSELKKHPKGKVKQIKVKVGEMLHLEPESVKMHFELLTKGTRLEGIGLDLEEVPVTVCCLDCRAEGQVTDHHLLLCDNCDSRNVKITSGNNILIDSIELEGASG